MANGRRDVDLVIRARNEASKAIDSVEAALSNLLKAQDSVGKSATSNGSLLEQLGVEIGKLKQQVQGASVMERFATSLDSAKQAVDRLETSVAEARAEQARLTASINESERSIADFEKQSARAAAVLEKQTAKTVQARDAQRQYNKDLAAAERAQVSAANAYEKAGQAFDVQVAKLEGIAKAQNAAADSVDKSANPTRQQISLYERLSAAYDKQEAKVDAAGKKYIDLAGEADKADAALAKLQGQADGVAARFDKANAEQTAAANSLKIIQQQAAEAATNLSRLRTSASQNESALERQNVSLAEARAEMEKVAAVTNQADAALDQISGTIRQRLLRSLADAQASLIRYREQWQAAQAAVRASVAGGSDVNNPTPELAGSLLTAKTSKLAYQEIQQAIQQMRTAVRGAGDDFEKLSAAQQNFVGAQKRVQEAISAVAGATTEEIAALNRESEAAQRSNAVRDRLVAFLQTERGQRIQAAEAARAQAAAMGEADSKARPFAATLGLLESNGRKSLSFLQRLRGELLSLAASYVGFYAAIQQVGGVVESYRSLEAANARLGVVFDQNSQKVSTELTFVQQLADRLSLNFKTLAEEYSKFAVSTKGTPLEGDQTRKIFEAVATAARAANLSGEQVSGTFLALSQMVSKGVVSMEELRRQLGDRLYGAFQLAAKSIGVTTQQLDKLVSSGQLASTTLLPRFAQELEKTFGPQLGASLDTLNADIEQFQNELFKAQIAAAKGGFIDSLRTALKDLTQYFKSDEGRNFFITLGKAAGVAVEILAAIPQHFGQIVTVLSVLVGIKASVFLRTLAADFALAVASAAKMPAAMAASNAAISAGAAEARGLSGILRVLGASYTSTVSGVRTAAASFAASVTSLNAARIASAALTGAMGLLRGALAALGGIPGLIITGLTLILGQWLTSTNDATDALEAHEKQVNSVRDAYNSANGAAGDWAKTIKDTSALEIKLNTKDLQRSLVDLRGSSSVNPIADVFGKDSNGTVGQLNQATEAFRAGVLSAKDFKEAVEKIATADPKLNEGIVRGMIDVANKAIKAEQAIKENEAALRALDGSATEADKAMLGLSKSTSTTASAATDLTSAIQKLQQHIPSLKLAADRAKELKELDDLKFNVDLTGVDKSSKEYKEFLDLIDKGKKEINAKFDEQTFGRLADRIIAAESGGRPNASNPNSTAVGTGQFIESTWLKLFKEYFPDRAEGMTRDAILELRKNAEVSKALVEAYAKENADVLQKAGVSVNDAAVYLAHFLGPQGALKVLQAAPNTPVSSVLSQKQINANQSVLGGDKTAGQLVEWAQKRVGLTDQQVQLEGQVNRALSAQADKAAEYHKNLQANLEIQEQQVAPVKKRTLEEEVQAALLKAQNDARKAGTALSQQELDQITRITTEKYNQKHAEDEINEAKKTQREMDRELNKAVETRSALYKQYLIAQSQGDTDKAADLKKRYDDISSTLSDLIQKQIAYWQSVGGDEADIAIAKLQAVSASMSNVGKEFLPTAESINKSIATGLGGTAIDNFISKLKEGQSVFSALKDSFLQFASDFLLKIAEMILQQVIFNALQNSSFGGAVAGAAAGVLHTGGIAGSAAGNSRSVPASWFANARRYHSGGIAGLAPNEVPAILQKNEEVLTRDDPRHIMNGGGAGGGNPGSVKVVNAIDSGSFISAGLNTREGEKAIFNYIRANKSAVRRELGL